MKKKQADVFLIGEARLIAELGEQCLEKGFRVLYQLNPSEKAANLTPKLKPSNTIPRKVLAVIELTNADLKQKKNNLKKLERALGTQILIASSSVTVTVSTQSLWLRHPHRLVGISALPTLVANSLIELAPSVHSDKKFVRQAAEFFSALGKETSLVQDRVGMVLPRILCMLINEAFFAVMEGIASPSDIDTAMKLGTNYPHGPIEWANKIGVSNVYAVLKALQNDLQEERYRIAPLLQQMASGTTWWKN